MTKIAIVTGASRGIGSAIAYRLSKEGYAVCINYYQSKAQAEELKNRIISEGGNAIAVYADVACRSEVDEMVSRTKEAFGGVSLLVNNAGIAAYSQFQDLTGETWRRIFAVNVNGAFNACQAVLPDLLHEHAGCIVNISSIWGQNGASCETAYSSTKHAIIGLTRSLAAELAPSGIRVNCVAPGVIRTDMLNTLDKSFLDVLCEQTPMGRLGTAQEIAAVVAFLASEEASFITGQVLTADGGFRL